MLLGISVIACASKQGDAPPAPGSAARVVAVAETEPVDIEGDAADDPAIWLHPEEHHKSLIIATQKWGGLYVYDLNGKVLQWLPDGEFNNVDLRYNFLLADGSRVDVVATSKREDNSIALYAIDSESLRLYPIGGGDLKTGLNVAYGLCMARQDATGADGAIEHYRLLAREDNRIGIRRVRAFKVETRVEGCVVDDRSATLYVAEEDFGIWKFRAWGGGSTRGQVLARVNQNDVVGDIEGLAIMHLADGGGYLVASSQGNDSFAVFDLSEGNQWLGRFGIVGSGDGVDAVSGTDGLEVMASAIGPYSQGLVVTQDDQNSDPDGNQNFKLVPWESVAAAMGLERFPQWDPRYP
jgi:3-phytase